MEYADRDLVRTLYHNYKGLFSLIFIAICDASYCFTLFDIGLYGSNNYSGPLANSKMDQMFENGSMNVPCARQFDGCQEPLLCFLLGDEMFPLKTGLLRPYPGQNASEKEGIYKYEKSVGTTELHYSMKEREHCFSILEAFFVRHPSEYETSDSDRKVKRNI